jgi:hypothetical protein
MKWHVSGSLQLGDLFEKLEEVKTSLNIVHYSVSQCTLEHVFIRFAKEQHEEQDRTQGIVY